MGCTQARTSHTDCTHPLDWSPAFFSAAGSTFPSIYVLLDQPTGACGARAPRMIFFVTPADLRRWNHWYGWYGDRTNRLLMPGARIALGQNKSTLCGDIGTHKHSYGRADATLAWRHILISVQIGWQKSRVHAGGSDGTDGQAYGACYRLHGSKTTKLSRLHVK